MLSPYFLWSQQELAPPEISHLSGFYTSGIDVTITTSDDAATILYTLDGSTPTIENLAGKEWHYKKNYPAQVGDPVGSLYNDTLWTYTYEGAIHVQDRTTEISVIEKVSTSMEDYSPPIGDVFKGTVLRAVVYKNGEYSEVITRNYYITPEGNNRYHVPVLSISVDNDKLYGYEEGINVPGKKFDDWRAANPDVEGYAVADANYLLRGEATESEIHFSYIEEGIEILNHGAGIRINGQYSRHKPNKSFRLYAKKAYGQKYFSHFFFDEYSQKKFERLILRNGGNDDRRTIFRDEFMHRIVRNLNVDIQEAQAVVVFINGEYNGIRNLRERYDKKYFKNIYGLEEDSLDFIKFRLWYHDVKEGDDEKFYEMLNFFTFHSLESDEYFNEAMTYLDPINYTDYLLANIFYNNTDWFNNNYQFWRKKVEYNPGIETPYGHDGRFRWNIQDTDFGFGLYFGKEFNMLEWATEEREEETGMDTYFNYSSLLLRKMLENQNYEIYFINRFADLLNSTFTKMRLLDGLYSYKIIYEPHIDENYKRWGGYNASHIQWLNDFEVLVDFAENRSDIQRQHIIDFFNLNGKYDLVLNVNDDAMGYIHLNTIDIIPGTDGIEEYPYLWLGQYFKGVPITVKAVAKEGYKFSHWSGASSDTISQITLTLHEDAYLKAHFIPDETSGIAELGKKEDIILYPNPASTNISLLSDDNLEDTEYIIYSIEGKLIQRGKLSGMKLNISNLKNGRYIIQFTNEKWNRVKSFIKM